jgi:hypothetical protein
MDHAMNDPGDFLPETETTVPIVRGPGEGKVVEVLRDQSTFKMRLLLTVIPGRFSNFFIDVDGVDDGDHAAIKALAAKYDVEILE